VIFFLVQRTDAGVFSPAWTIDPEYSKALAQCVDAGVEIITRDVDITLDRICIANPVDVDLFQNRTH
ncbi:MAG: DNA/RNA nuclease SfsA, partial [Desulfobacteraceae bacterium]